MSNYFYVEPIEVNVNLINTAPDPFPFKRFIVDIGTRVEQLPFAPSTDAQYAVAGDYIYIADGGSLSGLDDRLVTKRISEPLNAWRKLTNETNLTNIENNSWFSGFGTRIRGKYEPNNILKTMTYVSYGGARVELTIEGDKITSYNNAGSYGYSGTGYYIPSLDSFAWPFEGGVGSTIFYVKRYGETSFSSTGPNGQAYFQNSFCDVDGFLHVFPVNGTTHFTKKIDTVNGTMIDVPTRINATGSNYIYMYRLNKDKLIALVGNTSRIHEVTYDGSTFVATGTGIFTPSSSSANIILFDEYAILGQGNGIETNSVTLIRPDLSTTQLNLGNNDRYYNLSIIYDQDGNVHLLYCAQNANKLFSQRIGRFEY